MQALRKAVPEGHMFKVLPTVQYMYSASFDLTWNLGLSYTILSRRRSKDNGRCRSKVRLLVVVEDTC